MSTIRGRLAEFLLSKGQQADIERLTPDASVREYFRVGWHESRAIVCVYPDAFVALEQSYLDVSNLFIRGGLPVAKILDFDERLGIIVLEDFGDRILREELQIADSAYKEKLINDAISIIPRIQATTRMAFETNSVASRLRFDTEKLLWELDFFKTHYFDTFKKLPLSNAVDAALGVEFKELSCELEKKAIVLCHRDFHAANLMLDQKNGLRIIDHQDARMGSVAYDLASFLLDRVTEPPTTERLAEKRRLFLDRREEIGLENIAEDEFADEFRLQSIQRCLKAIGTFSFQSVNRGKIYFVPFIKPMFQIVLRAAENLDRFPNLRRIIKEQL